MQGPCLIIRVSRYTTYLPVGGGRNGSECRNSGYGAKTADIYPLFANWSIYEALTADESTSRMAETEFLQPAMFAVQVALVGHAVGYGKARDSQQIACTGMSRTNSDVVAEILMITGPTSRAAA
jgi:hypothetical protein